MVSELDYLEFNRPIFIEFSDQVGLTNSNDNSAVDKSGYEIELDLVNREIEVSMNVRSGIILESLSNYL